VYPTSIEVASLVTAFLISIEYLNLAEVVIEE
jgi:hypothetical protein